MKTPDMEPRPITLCAAGVRSIAGDHPQVLLGTVISHLVLPSAGDDYPLWDQQQKKVEAIIWPADDPEKAPMDDVAFTGRDTSREGRLAELLSDAVEQTLDHLRQQNSPSPQHLLLSLPDSRADHKKIIRHLHTLRPELTELPLTLCSSAALTEALQELMQRLAQPRDANPLDCALFAGVDSSAEISLLTQRLANDELRTVKNSQGRAAGEAAACVALVAGEYQTPRSAGVAAIHGQDEPLYENLEHGTPVGLADAARLALTRAEFPPAALHNVVLARAETSADEFEWLQVRKALWPVRLDETQRKAMRRGELDAPTPEACQKVETLRPALTTGDTGAAALPLALALAAERFDFFHQHIDNSLVLYNPEGKTRLAMLLTRIPERPE
mgnify:CR=1 FL=1